MKCHAQFTLKQTVGEVSVLCGTYQDIGEEDCCALSGSYYSIPRPYGVCMRAKDGARSG